MPEKDYPAYRQQLRSLMGRLGRELPGTVNALGQLHTQAMADGALDAKTKELIALGIAISVRCEGCIAYHVYNCLEAGAARPEILETIGVAIAMGGGPSAVYGCEALQALEQYDARNRE
jgi:AhpD family alkylhydroperoxidase